MKWNGTHTNQNITQKNNENGNRNNVGQHFGLEETEWWAYFF